MPNKFFDNLKSLCNLKVDIDLHVTSYRIVSTYGDAYKIPINNVTYLKKEYKIKQLNLLLHI